MATKTKDSIPLDVMADLEKAAHYAATGQHPSPEFVRRIAEEAEKIREEVKRKHGILDIGVPAIRELRDA
jgi:hypothetical protein